MLRVLYTVFLQSSKLEKKNSKKIINKDKGLYLWGKKSTYSGSMQFQSMSFVEEATIVIKGKRLPYNEETWWSSS